MHIYVFVTALICMHMLIKPHNFVIRLYSILMFIAKTVVSVYHALFLYIITLVNVYVDLLVFTRIAGTS